VAAVVVSILSLIAFCLVKLEGTAGIDNTGTQLDFAFLSLSVIFLVEGMLLIVSVILANNRIRKRLKKEIENVPYVPLS